LDKELNIYIYILYKEQMKLKVPNRRKFLKSIF